jgi:hypothetical protein
MAGRSQGNKRTPPANRQRGSGSDIAAPGEKVVKETARVTRVKPVKLGADAKRPTPARALDRRREVQPSGPAAADA